MEQKTDLLPLLAYIDPVACTYQEWANIGMALKEEGYTHRDWETWSSRDTARYHPGECEKKWETFRGSNNPVTGGTVVQMAKDAGWKPDAGHEIDWNGEIQRDGDVVVDSAWVEEKEINEPGEGWKPEEDLIRYIETLFEPEDHVGYCVEVWEQDGKLLPTKGSWDRTAAELLDSLRHCGGDIGAALGDYNQTAGAWIRFNPLDGNGVKNDNVTEFRYALVESDSQNLAKQNAILHELELPIACLTYSGKKSLHAIVRIDAKDYEEYRKRVDTLYTVCKKNGLEVDSQNRNPSRLSRMPGIVRGEHKQFLMETNIGKPSWTEWTEWMESVNDSLPDPESLASVWDNLPELAPPLIDGVLRMGHKMLIAGPSKAGKSFALIELCIAVAEGGRWFGWKCKQGRILYVNLELDRASCLHRFKDVYAALGLPPNHIDNISIWNLRGSAVPMDKLAPKLIRRATKQNYIAVVIDPIYKVITGDENSADQMAAFCNQFDKICNELNTAVIYCHHHSKGYQGGKRSMDRASGSGVFARDPDALLDLVELETTDSLRRQEESKAVCAVCADALNKIKPDWMDTVSQDDFCSDTAMLAACRSLMPGRPYENLLPAVNAAREKTKIKTAWRIEGTLREFPRFDPVNVWFDYPIHRHDDSGALKDVQPAGEAPQSWKGTWKKNFKKPSPEEAKKTRKESIETAFEACNVDGNVLLSDLAEYMGATEKTVRNRLKEHGGFWIDDGKVGKK